MNLLPEAQQKSKMSQFKEQEVIITKTGKRFIIIEAEQKVIVEEEQEEYWLDDKQFNCSCCIGYFEAGKDNCRECGFDMNQWNEPEESDNESDGETDEETD